MNTCSDSSFSFQTKRGRQQQLKCLVPPGKKPRRNTVKKAVLHIKPLGLPLISGSTGQCCESLCLEPHKPYTIGRKLRFCDFIFSDRRVSKRHCQLYFDSLEKKIYLSDGLFLDHSECSDSVSRVSTNGVFVNGVRISGVAEVGVGDVVCLICRNEEVCGFGVSIGFLVEKTAFVEEVDYRSLIQLNPCGVHPEQASLALGCDRLMDDTGVLLSWCRDILCSDDPVSYIRKCVVLDQRKRIDLAFREGLKKYSALLLDNGCSNGGLQSGCRNRKRVYSREVETVENCDVKSGKEIIVVSEQNTELKCSDVGTTSNADIARQSCAGGIDIGNGVIASDDPSGLPLGERDYFLCGDQLDEKSSAKCILPPGKKFYLNHLQFWGQEEEKTGDYVSLPELFHPIENLKQVFIATFTSDILWFLSYCNIPPNLPVTIACHSAERCWSVDPDKRTSVPFSDFPNLTLVYPPFPEVIAFNRDRKNLGIACHHPKFFVLQREDSLRVVITSANLVANQGRRHKLGSCVLKFLSSVEASVVGLSHIYRARADSNGEQLKKLALFLGKCHEKMDGMSEIILRRDTNIPADGNAVSVLIPNPEDSSMGDSVQLGFLPRNVAKWVAPLSDIGLFAFSAYIHPKEVLAAAIEGSNNKVKLILNVYAVLGQYNWPEHLESEFVFGSSSVGSVNAQFLAAFSAAAGKRSVPFSDSEESDPDWGCWNASQELKNPSVRIIFPSIEGVKNNRSGIMASRRILCFSQRLKNIGILHDAIPYPSDRIGFPMHVKVGRRRFESKDGSSFGWVYCGSHNFSAAAWGRPMSDRQLNGNVRNTSVLGSRLHISNYELGIIFIVPPPETVDHVKQDTQNLDDIVLPFVMPPPKYRPRDQPATAPAIREALAELSEQEREINEAVLALSGGSMEEEITEEEEEAIETAQYVAQEKEDEKAYADKLWSQVDSSQSC
ncbi:UNVERIFIED_CONTAM: hypothetical protein Slati_3380200 [Sesamum latifolium]|uniref:FHA domain-containing protein n=1 Tax=Sesamum latifolium TaxID=2727402 RepID=A0AAW2UEB6_9LAMI